LREPQALAAGLLAEVLAGRSLNQALPDLWRHQPRLSSQQRGAVQDLIYGTLRHLSRLERYLEALLHKPTGDPELKHLLLVSLYQLDFARTPSHAAVNQAVQAAKGHGRDWAAGFVNGVLRNFLRRREELHALADRRYETRYSYPRWWIDKLRARYPEQYTKVLESGLTHPPMTLRVNVRKTTREGYETLLRDQGVEFRVLGPTALQLAHPTPVERLPRFADGWVSVQDFGAQLAAPMLDATAGMRVLDACSAPGGKAAHLLESTDLDLWALDRDEARLARVDENLRRLGLTAQVKAGDATNPGGWWDGKPFQRILADVPCSASGVVRRHPDIKWLRRPEDIALFAAEQARILKGLWRVLEVDGKLLYVTCSLFAEENDKLVQTFLAEHIDAERLPLPSFIDHSGQLLPDPTHDGFFYALIAKRPPPR
jgi:16S rRNA (cytosine967-C5)-methyltransferase